MKLKNIYYAIAGIVALTVVGCQDDANDWGMDNSHDRLFRTTNFTVEEKLPTSATLLFNGVKGATKYQFEISKGDSLLFTNIVLTEEIRADTLTPKSESSNIVNTEYLKLFENLDGTSRYSVRMKAIDEVNNMESGYAQLYFDTPAEQIFTAATPGISNATLNWQGNKTTTHLTYGTLVRADEEAGIAADTIWAEPYTLSAAEQAAGECVLSNLTSGTNYIAQIYNNDVLRGSYRFKTLGSSSSTPVLVTPTDDINAVLAAATGDVTLVFESGGTYEMGDLIVPAGIDNLYLAGNVIGGKLPKLIITKLTFNAPMNNFAIQYMDVEGNGKSNYMFEARDANCPYNINFEGSFISKYSRSVVRLDNPDIEMNNLSISNCIMKEVSTSGYGMFNLNRVKTLNSVSITNSTLWNIADQLIDLRVDIGELIMTGSTVYNSTIRLPKAFRLEKQPNNVRITGVIWSGNNNNGKTDAGFGDYSAWISYAGCYRTADLQINRYEFTDAVVLNITSDELYVNPAAGDFHFKPEAEFGGDGKVGDPRWWTVK